MVELAGAVDGRPLPIGCCSGSEMNSGVLPEAMRAGRGSVPTWKREAYSGTCAKQRCCMGWEVLHGVGGVACCQWGTFCRGVRSAHLLQHELKLLGFLLKDAALAGGESYN